MLTDFYSDELVLDFSLLSAPAFVAAIRGYSESTIGRLLDRRQQPEARDLFEGGGDIEVSVARSRADLSGAAELVRHQYAARGYFADTEHPDQATPGAARRASVILARSHGRVVGTLTVVIDSPAGLFADEVNGEFLEPLRAKGRRLSELVRLAVSHQHDTDSRKVLAALFNAAHGILAANRLHDVLIEVNPRHVGFYRRALCFEVAGDEQVCPRVNAPSVLLRMTLADLTRKIGSLERAIAEFPLGQIRKGPARVGQDDIRSSAP
jgi:hypothetical protein